MARDNGSPGGKIGERIAQLITRSRVATEAQLGGVQAERTVRTMSYFFEKAGVQAAPALKDMFERVLADPDLPPEMRASFEHVIGTPDIITDIAKALFMPLWAFFAAGNLAEPLAQGSVSNMWATFPHKPLDAPTAAAAWRRQLWDEGRASTEAGKTGIGPSRFNALQALTRRFPSLDILHALINRGKLSKGQAANWLEREGFIEGTAEEMVNLREIVAPPQDLIRFAVREAYSPEIARQFGQYEDFPAQAMGDASKVGVSRELMEKYWAAHWALPSAQQGFEMFHRGIISESILKLLLRALDVMPFWRDKLIQMAYSPLRLVDIRRFYRDGVMTKEQVHDAYLSRGYSPENAELSTRWTIQQKMNTERDLTKAEIVSLYESQLLSRKKAHALVKDLGYDNSEADFILALPEARRERSRVTAGVRRVLTRYAARKIDRVRAATTLDRLEIPADERDELLQLAELEREITAPDLSVSQFQGLLRRGAVTAERFTTEMRNRGYTDEEINWLGELSFPAPRATAST